MCIDSLIVMALMNAFDDTDAFLLADKIVPGSDGGGGSCVEPLEEQSLVVCSLSSCDMSFD